MGRKASLLAVVAGVTLALASHFGASVIALPPPEDTPEEVLRTEIITEARSPIDGKPLNASQYAELEAQLQTHPVPELAPVIRQNIFLLQLLKNLRLIFPFLKF